MAEHTPTPWVEFVIDGKCVAIMPAGRFRDICEFRVSPSDADAAFIVKAVNSHASLVKALTDLVEVSAPNIYPQPDKPIRAWAVLQRARFALALATAEVSPPVATEPRP